MSCRWSCTFFYALRLFNGFVPVPPPLSFFLSRSVKPELGPTAQAIERTQSSIVGPIHLILLPKSLYYADEAWFSRLLVGCLRLHRCIRRKTCVGDVNDSQVRDGKMANFQITDWLDESMYIKPPGETCKEETSTGLQSFERPSRLDHPAAPKAQVYCI